MSYEDEDISFLRYFLWADCMRNSFEKELRRTGIVDLASSEGFSVAMYMSFWYSFLKVVIEGWQDLKLIDPEIDSLLASSNVGLLTRYRNATFHYQNRYMHNKFTDFIYEGESSADWVRAIHNAFARYVTDRFGKLPEW